MSCCRGTGSLRRLSRPERMCNLSTLTAGAPVPSISTRHMRQISRHLVTSDRSYSLRLHVADTAANPPSVCSAAVGRRARRGGRPPHIFCTRFSRRSSDWRPLRLLRLGQKQCARPADRGIICCSRRRHQSFIERRRQCESTFAKVRYRFIRRQPMSCGGYAEHTECGRLRQCSSDAMVGAAVESWNIRYDANSPPLQLQCCDGQSRLSLVRMKHALCI